MDDSTWKTWKLHESAGTLLKLKFFLRHFFLYLYNNFQLQRLDFYVPSLLYCFFSLHSKEAEWFLYVSVFYRDSKSLDLNLTGYLLVII